MLLIETSDLTKQLRQALERRDEVSAQMILGMRETPIHSMQEIAAGIDQYILSLPEDSAIRGHELLTGAPAENDLEIPLCEEVARFQRLLKTVVDMDKVISLKLAGDQSLYTKL